jgi:hypothetical protein
MALGTSLLTDGIAFGGGFAMAIVSYLDDFDADPETKRVLHLALEMTRKPLGLQTILPADSSPSKSSNLPGPGSGIPTFCAKAH